MATVMDYLDRFLPQEFSRVVFDTEKKVDPLFQRIESTWEGVSSDDISNDWRVQHTYTSGMAGAARYRAAKGGAPNTWPASGTAIAALGQGTLNSFISFADAVHPGDVQRAIELVQCDGVLSLPIQVLRADRLSAGISRKVTQIMKGTARTVATLKANSFYATRSATDQGEWGNTGDISNTISGNASKAITFTPDSSFGSRHSRFRIGEAVDFVASGDFTTIRNGGGTPVPFIVTSVDYISEHDATPGAIKFEALDNSTTATLQDNDRIVPASYGTHSDYASNNLPFGYKSWMKNSGTLFDTATLPNSGSSSLSLSTHPWFKSLVKAEGSVFQSEALLNKRYAAFWDAYGGLYKVTHCFQSAGVLNGYLAGIDSLLTYDRGTGAELRLKEGFVGLDYQYMGQPVEMLVSPCIASNEAVHMDLSDGNLVEYTAPPLPGAGSDSNVGRVEFVNPIMGGTGIWTWASTVSSSVVRRTDFAEAIFMYLHNYAPSKIPGILQTGLSESI